MRKTEFFRNHGGGLVKVNNDNAEYGDYLLIHSEEVDIAKRYKNDGYTIVAAYEVEDEEYIDISQPCDFGYQPFKIGYYVLEVVNSSFNAIAYR